MNNTTSGSALTRTKSRHIIWSALALAFVALAVFLTVPRNGAKREWEAYQKELIASGVHLDWTYYIPPPVKDEENFYAAPGMERFQKTSGTTVESPWSLPSTNAAWANSEKGEWIDSANGNRYPKTVLYDWEKQRDAALQQFFAACQRPKARINADYAAPPVLTYPNFVAFRVVAQTCVTLAKIHLNDGHPERALPYLRGTRRLMRCLEGGSRLVDAMVHNAIAGLYVDVVQYGLDHHSFTDEQLEEQQRELATLNLLKPVGSSLRAQTASMLQTMKTVPARQIFEGSPAGDASWIKRIGAYFGGTFYALKFSTARERNLLNYTQTMVSNYKIIDDSTQRVSPKLCAAFDTRIAKTDFSSRDNLLIAVALPNYSKAIQTAARNQTLVNEAQIACALERYHRAERSYPANLTHLSPRFLAEPPQDVVCGQPLHYQRLTADSFLLYSVGWDETDDQGTPSDWVWGKMK